MEKERKKGIIIVEIKGWPLLLFLCFFVYKIKNIHLYCAPLENGRQQAIIGSVSSTLLFMLPSFQRTTLDIQLQLYPTFYP